MTGQKLKKKELNIMMKRQIEKFVDSYLEEEDLTTLLAQFNIEPNEVIVLLIEQGWIDEDQLERMIGADVLIGT